MSERDSLFDRALAGDADAMQEWTSGLYKESGGDPERCEECRKPLDDAQPWQRGLDGAGIHCACLPDNPDEEEVHG